MTPFAEGFLGAILGSLVGALVGGSLSYFGAMRAAHFTTERTAALDRQRREDERVEINRRLATQLLAEMKDNIRVLEKPKLEFGFAVLVHDIWDSAKGQVLLRHLGLVRKQGTLIRKSIGTTP